MFVFAQPIGNDTIYNFNVATDKIDLMGFANIASFSDIKANIADDGNGDAVITLGAGETITLHGVNAASLTASDFVFNQTPVVENAGTMTVSDGAVLPLGGTIDNTGTIALNSTGDQTELQIVGAGITLQGGGQVMLSGNAENNRRHESGHTLTNVDNTISGAGQIGSGDGNSDAGQRGARHDQRQYRRRHAHARHRQHHHQRRRARSDQRRHAADRRSVIGSGSAIIAGGTLIFDAQSNVNVTFDNGAGRRHTVSSCSAMPRVSPAKFPDLPEPHPTRLIRMRSIWRKSITTRAAFSETYNASTGVLTVTDGTQSASLTFENVDGSFSFASDGNSGTLITDPPATRPHAVRVYRRRRQRHLRVPSGIGAETINNFNPQNDTIELDHFANIQNSQELAATITPDAHGNAVLELGHNDSITIPGMSAIFLQPHLQSLVHSRLSQKARCDSLSLTAPPITLGGYEMLVFNSREGRVPRNFSVQIVIRRSGVVAVSAPRRPASPR